MSLPIPSTNNTYSGSTTVSAGILEVGDDSSASTRTLSQNSNLRLNGGLLQSTGTFTRATGTAAGQVQLTDASTASGFAAGWADLLVNLGNGAQLTWGTNSFMTASSQLSLNSPTSLGVVTLANPINLGGAVRAVAIISAVRCAVPDGAPALFG